MAEEPGIPFRLLLKQERKAIPGMTQARLADLARLSWREISDLETGRTKKPHEDTVLRLADALELSDPRRAAFLEAGLGWNPSRRVSEVTASGETIRQSDASTQDDAQERLARIVRELDERGVEAARSVLADWQRDATADIGRQAWVNRLIALTDEGRVRSVSQRPLPNADKGAFVDRRQQTTELDAFLDRIQRGRGGLALVIGPAGIGKSRLVLNVVDALPDEIRLDWLTVDRGEAGYRGWRRLLAPLWITLRRTELAPTTLLPHSEILDDILLVGGEGEPGAKPFPGEVADAISTLLSHAAEHMALVLVMDDFHRGGATSDQLMLDVARRVNACRVGFIAVLRPDELEQESPLRGYSEEADGRSAADVVVTIHVPPLDRIATAGLLRARAGVEPPTGIVDQVLQLTGGFPQLIDSTDLQVPLIGTPTASWAVRGLDTKGLRILESIIASRSETERTVLQAAAVSAVGGYIQPDLTARVAELHADLVEQVLDRERRSGTILTPQASGYRFRHDNWIDVVIDSCPAAKLHLLHARCLTAMRADPACDPRRLAHHATRAGGALVDARDLVDLAKAAADVSLADYAFSGAAELYEVAAQHAESEERIDLLIRQSDALRFQGRWVEGRSTLKHAISLAKMLEEPGHEAVALIHLERLTWTYGLDEKDLTQQLRDVLTRLPDGETVLRAQAQAALAMRLSITSRQYDNEQAYLARAALQQLPSISDPTARADVLLGVRHGLQDTEPPEMLLDLDRQVLDLAIDIYSAYHMEEALTACVIDILRSGRLLELPSAIRAHRDFTGRSGVSWSTYSQAIIDAMLALARGEFDVASKRTAEASDLSAPWGASMAGETLMAQAGWLLYETGQVVELAEMLEILPQQDVSSLNEHVWALAAGIIHAETGNGQKAIRIFRQVCTATRDLGDLPRGPGRIGILAAAAMVLGHPVVCDALPQDEAAHVGDSLAALLTAHHDKLVVAGWPAVLLGSKHRYIGLAYLAARQSAKAADHLTRAVDDNSDLAVLRARTCFDLARSLIQQPLSRADGLAEMGRVRQDAADLKMAGLVTQATAELKRWHSGER